MAVSVLVAGFAAYAIPRRPAPPEPRPSSLATIEGGGACTPRGTWYRAPAPGSRVIRLFAACPDGNGRHPAVVVLHGTDGLRVPYLRFARRLAAAGFVGVAGCWFAGSYGRALPADARHPGGALIDCPRGPSFKGASLEAVPDVAALIAAVDQLAAVRPGDLGLYGHSRGATMALLTDEVTREVRAVVADAGIYTQGVHEPRFWPYHDTLPTRFASRLRGPVLLVHGTADQAVPISQARDFDALLGGLGKPVQTLFLPGGRHGVLFERRFSAEVMRRTVAFFRDALTRVRTARGTRGRPPRSSPRW